MGMAFDPDSFPAVTSFFIRLFQTIDFPLLLIAFGSLFTGLIQSSSAATGIFIMMVSSGALGLENALFLVLGSNIGTCVTAVLASVGAGINAKRTALIHLSFNVIGTVIFATFIWIFKGFVVSALQSLIGLPAMQLAWFHVIFNVTTTLILLPFIKQLVAFATKVIPERKTKEETRQLKFVDERLLKTPPIAIMQVKKEIEYMSSLAQTNIERALNAVCESTDEKAKELFADEEIIDFTNKSLAKYLIKLSPLVDNGDEKKIGAYFHVLNDVERIGDHAENFQKIATQMQNEGLTFSQSAREEIRNMGEKVRLMFELATETFGDADVKRLAKLTALENEVDALKRELSARHFERLANGDCRVEVSAYFFSVVAGLERVADHLINVGYSILNPTGSQSEARAKAQIPAME